MYTDPNYLRASDPGTVEGNVVFTYLDAFCDDLPLVEDLKARYRRGGLGDMVVKRELEGVLQDLITPIRQCRKEVASDPAFVLNVLAEGTRQAQEHTQRTLEEVKTALGLFAF